MALWTNMMFFLKKINIWLYSLYIWKKTSRFHITYLFHGRQIMIRQITCQIWREEKKKNLICFYPYNIYQDTSYYLVLDILIRACII